MASIPASDTSGSSPPPLRGRETRAAQRPGARANRMAEWVIW